MPDYLSPDWVDQLRRAVDADEELAALARGVELTLQQTVTDAPSGSVAYYITFSDGEVFVQAGQASEPDVSFTQDYPTAVGVATGTVSALDAMRDGRVLITGDPTTLTANMELFAALDQVFTEVRAGTTYPESSRR